MKLLKLTATCALIIFIKFNIYAQSLPVGTTAIEDYFRRAQLSGVADTNVSFTVRPIFPTFINKKADVFYPDTSQRRQDILNIQGSLQTDDKNLKFGLLPLSIQTEFNSGYPYGWNDGAMIPARGWQTLVSPGLFLQYGPLTVQLKPEFVDAQNSNFSTFNPGQYGAVFARYYDIYNNIDLPVRFGTTPYQKAYWGQSSIRLNFKSLSFGLSTENLWWGPGIQNSLLMSNTAPGFPHLTFNTSRPLKTAIGSFEGQIIAGRLSNSGYPPLEPDYIYFNTDLYVPKPADWRYLAGIIVTWQPKWVPGLFLGFDQSKQTYGKDLGNIQSYLPLFSPVKSISPPNNPINQSDKLGSLFMRWLWVKEQAELYFEIGQYNNTEDFLQELLDPGNSRAYIFGIRKLLPFNKSDNENILISIEATQLQENSLTSIENGTEWYVSQAIRSGYTNQGQELGAGIGPGGNLQSLDISWVKGLKKIGLQFQRYVHNNDFYGYAFEDIHDYTRHWVDLSAAATMEWDYKNLIFNVKLQGIQSLNYQWFLKNNASLDTSFLSQLSAYNLQIQAGVSYRF